MKWTKEYTKEYKKQWAKNNPEKVKLSKKKWRENNPEYMKEYDKKWKKENPEKLKKASKKYREKNQKKMKKATEKWRENNPEKVKKYSKIYKKENPEKVNFNTAKRRARKFNAEGSHTLQEWQELKKKCNYICQMCGLKEPFENQRSKYLTEDHKISLSKGGSDYIDNIQPLCHHCNSSKGNKVEIAKEEKEEEE